MSSYDNEPVFCGTHGASKSKAWQTDNGQSYPYTVKLAYSEFLRTPVKTAL